MNLKNLSPSPSKTPKRKKRLHDIKPLNSDKKQKKISELKTQKPDHDKIRDYII